MSQADCRIHNVGHEFEGNCGVTAFYSRGLRLLHNEIYDIPYTGILCLGSIYTTLHTANTVNHRALDLTCVRANRNFCRVGLEFCPAQDVATDAVSLSK